MAEVIRMPRMSDTMEEGVIVEWMKKVGDEVEAGETIAEVETDKATMELDSYVEGTLLYIAVEKGAVPINGVIAVIGEKGEDYQTALTAAEATSNNNGAASKPEPKEETAAPPPSVTAPAPQPEVVATASTDERIKASPLAKSMAKEAGIQLSALSGTGENGRIVKRDIESYLEQAKSAPAAQPATPAALPAMTIGGEAFTEERVTQMRKTIARRLGESKFSAPHFYLTIEINMDKAVKARQQINELAPTKISFNDLVLKAAAASLQQHPAINSSWMGDSIRRNQHVNIGVAVAVPDGLLVPVIRHANMKSLSQINGEVRHLAGKAKDKKLSPEEMSGNTFTISNLGMFGIEEFTAIINPPDACILAVGAIIDKAIVIDGKVKAGKMMKVTLSCDHRVVDGATGAQFLQTFKGILEEPIRLLV